MYWDLWGRSCGNLDTGSVFVIMSIAHAQSILYLYLCILCTVIILLCHIMLDPAVSSLVYGLVCHLPIKNFYYYYYYYYALSLTNKFVAVNNLIKSYKVDAKNQPCYIIEFTLAACCLLLCSFR